MLYDIPYFTTVTGGGGSGFSWSIDTAVNTADYTVDDFNYIILSDLTGQADRVIVLPAGSSGLQLKFINENSSGFKWSFTGTVKDWAGNTITDLANDTIYYLIYEGSFWRIQ